MILVSLSDGAITKYVCDESSGYGKGFEYNGNIYEPFVTKYSSFKRGGDPIVRFQGGTFSVKNDIAILFSGRELSCDVVMTDGEVYLDIFTGKCFLIKKGIEYQYQIKSQKEHLEVLDSDDSFVYPLTLGNVKHVTPLPIDTANLKYYAGGKVLAVYDSGQSVGFTRNTDTTFTLTYPPSQSSTGITCDIDDNDSTATTVVKTQLKRPAQLFYTTPTVPYYKDDVWLEGTTSIAIKKCTTPRLSGSYTAGDWTVVGTFETGADVTDYSNVEIANVEISLSSDGYLTYNGVSLGATSLSGLGFTGDTDATNTADAMNAGLSITGTDGGLKAGKTAYSDDTSTGWFMGRDGGTAKANIGGANRNLKWDGSSLKVTGITISSNGTDSTATRLMIIGGTAPSSGLTDTTRLCFAPTEDGQIHDYEWNGTDGWTELMILGLNQSAADYNLMELNTLNASNQFVRPLTIASKYGNAITASTYGYAAAAFFNFATTTGYAVRAWKQGSGTGHSVEAVNTLSEHSDNPSSCVAVYGRSNNNVGGYFEGGLASIVLKPMTLPDPSGWNSTKKADMTGAVSVSSGKLFLFNGTVWKEIALV